MERLLANGAGLKLSIDGSLRTNVSHTYQLHNYPTFGMDVILCDWAGVLDSSNYRKKLVEQEI